MGGITLRGLILIDIPIESILFENRGGTFFIFFPGVSNPELRNEFMTVPFEIDGVSCKLLFYLF